MLGKQKQNKNKQKNGETMKQFYESENYAALADQSPLGAV